MVYYAIACRIMRPKKEGKGSPANRVGVFMNSLQRFIHPISVALIAHQLVPQIGTSVAAVFVIIYLLKR